MKSETRIPEIRINSEIRMTKRNVTRRSEDTKNP
jgi:hypothetical protein